MIAETKALIDIVRSGEDVLLTEDGKPVLKVTAIAAKAKQASPEEFKTWIDEVTRHAEAASTGKKPQMTEQEFWDDMRADRC